MKNLLLFVLLLPVVAFGQVQINKPLELTGSGLDARVMGIDTVAGSKDAINVSTFQSGRLNYCQTTGTGNTYVVSIPYYTSSPSAGMLIVIKADKSAITYDPAIISINGYNHQMYTKNATPFHPIIGEVYILVFDGSKWIVF